MHFIKAIFLDEKVSDGAHSKFTRYSKGDFEGPFISIKNAGSVFRISGSVDYIDIVGKIIAKNGSNTITCSGKIVSKDKSIKERIAKYVEIKKAKEGLLSIYEIREQPYPKEKLSALYDDLRDEYVIFELGSIDGKFSLKPKKNLPKTGKQDNCFFTATLDLSAGEDLMNEIAFDAKRNFKEMTISHVYGITGFEIPEELKNDFKEARIKAKRKGIVKRILEIDCVKEEHQKEFLV